MDENPPQKEQSIKQQAVESLKNANNILVTVSANPSVDQLAACIGFTLMMNKLDKHATAVFSGRIPSTIEFLQPEKTLELTTDSLRDFIISLDKSKADKLRYKVEDDVVKIFITPYRTSITQEDLEFTQGDFNVDAVVALGISDKDDLDQAIIEQGRILHDAVVIGVSAGSTASALGTINWHDPSASSLSEMLVSISESFKTGLLDTQIATAFLTGIVSETERFSNDKTTPKVMTMSAQLMAAGANQQLIANQLAIKPDPEPIQETQAVSQTEEQAVPEPVSNPSVLGELKIDRTEESHDDTAQAESVPEAPKPSLEPAEPVAEPTIEVPEEPAEPVETQEALDYSLHDKPEENKTPANENTSEIAIDDTGKLVVLAEEEEKRLHHEKVIKPLNAPESRPKTNLRSYVFDNNSPAPMFTANTQPDVPQSELSADPSKPLETSLMPQNETSNNESATESQQVMSEKPEQTLADLERAVDSPHLLQADVPQSATNEEPSTAPPVPPPLPPFDSNEIKLPPPQQTL